MQYGGYLGKHPHPRDPKPNITQYAMIGEFGGIGAFLAEWQSGKCVSNAVATGVYGHGNATPTQQANNYIMMTKLIATIKDDVSASVYTQSTDVENECDVSGSSSVVSATILSGNTLPLTPTLAATGLYDIRSMYQDECGGHSAHI